MERTDARDLAVALMDYHGLSDWNFKFDRATRRFGLCSYSTKTISISLPLTRLNPVEEVRAVVLHEIAHALVGAGHGHDRVWKAKCREIGGNGQRTHRAQTPTKKYIGTCPSCLKKCHRDRRRQVACGTCCNVLNGGRYDERFKVVWSLNPEYPGQ